MPDARQPAELVLAAASGDQSAWDGLVARFGARMWAVARACGLGEQDAADAVQGAWLRLLEHLYDLKDPAGVGAWLATTTRREALLLLKKAKPGPGVLDVTHEPDPESAVLEADGNRLLWKTVATLKEPCRSLLTLVATDLGSRQVAVRLGLPVGSVGPTRARCLQKLRTLISLQETVQ
jgi:RNA polymerase sigma factor (sigma-70 family)